LLDRVIVVSDGSTDATAEIARRCGATVIELPQNCGKGAAIKAGLEHAASADVALLIDADLVGLSCHHIRALLQPVLDGSADMTMGVFGKGRLATDLALKLAPYLSGQRALSRQALEKLGALQETGYGVELALTRRVKLAGLRIEEVVLRNLTHRMKEEKLGLWRGLRARMRMYWEIALSLGRPGRG
ncbi:MAG: glycosyltransferase family 2 protein, partial [Acetobacteraceae bacterium]|nr:glycosyltransferase family 2 protein [Acetobacteraceae bacterium]